MAAAGIDERHTLNGVLTVMLKSAKGLKNTDASGKSDPYVKIQVADATTQSKTINGSLTPQWDQDLKLNVSNAPLGADIKLSVFDQDSGKDDLMGIVDIPLPDHPDAAGVFEAEWQPLRNSQNKQVGELLVGFGWDPISAIRKREAKAAKKAKAAADAKEQQEKAAAAASAQAAADAQAAKEREAAEAKAAEIAARQAAEDAAAARRAEKAAAPVDERNTLNGTLKVHLKKARELKDADFLGKSDPYVVAAVEDDVARSSVKNGTCDPVWEESLVIAVKNATLGANIEMSVYDDDGGKGGDPLKDDFLGKVLVPLPDHPDAAGVFDAEWQPVVDSKGKKHGELLVGFEWEPVSAQRKREAKAAKKAEAEAKAAADAEAAAAQAAADAQAAKEREAAEAKAAEIAARQAAEDAAAARRAEKAAAPVDERNTLNGTLKVHLKKARDLRDADFMGKSDPYVVAAVEDDVARSSVKNGTCDPVWEESLVIAVKNATLGANIEMSVYDDDGGKGGDPLKDDFLGKVLVPLPDHPDAAGVFDAEWQPVVDSKGKKHGELLVGFEWEPVSAQRKREAKAAKKAEAEAKAAADAEAAAAQAAADAQAAKEREAAEAKAAEIAARQAAEDAAAARRAEKAAAPVDERNTLNGTLKVHLKKARDLRDADFMGKSDPYVVAAVEDDVARSSVKSGTCDPVWEESLVIAVKNATLGANIEMSVYDDDGGKGGDPLKDDFLGKVLVPLPDHPDAAGVFDAEWQPVVDSKGKKHGELLVGFEWEPVSAQRKREAKAAKKAAEEAAAKAEKEAKEAQEAEEAAKKAEADAAAAAAAKEAAEAAEKAEREAREAAAAKEAEIAARQAAEDAAAARRAEKAAAPVDERNTLNGTLKVHLKKARDLRDADFLGKSDPYVVAAVEDDVARSSVKNGTCDPVWEESLVIAVKNATLGANIEMSVYDDDGGKGGDPLKDDFLGKVLVPLPDHPDAAGVFDAEWQPVVDSKGKKHGELLVGFEWEPVSAQRKREAKAAKKAAEEAAAKAEKEAEEAREAAAEAEKKRAEEEAATAAQAAADAKAAQEKEEAEAKAAAEKAQREQEEADAAAKEAAEAKKAAEIAARQAAEDAAAARRAEKAAAPVDERNTLNGTLKVHLKKARDLRDADFLGKSDPYVVAAVEDDVARSSVKNGTCDPVWEESLVIAVKNATLGANIEMSVYDDDGGKGGDPLKDDFLGKVLVPLPDHPDAAGVFDAEWQPVVDSKGKKHGELLVGFEWEPVSAQRKREAKEKAKAAEEAAAKAAADAQEAADRAAAEQAEADAAKAAQEKEEADIAAAKEAAEKAEAEAIAAKQKAEADAAAAKQKAEEEEAAEAARRAAEAKAAAEAARLQAEEDAKAAMDALNQEPDEEERKTLNGTLTVHLKKARDLKDADFIGKSDPYVKVSVDKAQARSKTIESTQNPEWNEEMKVIVRRAPLGETIHIAVLDDDGGNDDDLGEVTVPLPDDPDAGGEFPAEWQPVVDSKGKKHGELLVGFEWEPISAQRKRQAKEVADAARAEAKEAEDAAAAAQAEADAEAKEAADAEAAAKQQAEESKMAEEMSKTEAGREVLTQAMPMSGPGGDHALREDELLSPEEEAEMYVDPSVDERNTLNGKLEIHLLEARKLKDTDFLGSSDPFVVASVADVSKRSAIVKGTSEPKWDEHMVLQVRNAPLGSALLLKTRDDDGDDGAKFDELGQVEIPLPEDPDAAGEFPATWHPVVDPKSGKQHGELHVGLKWTPVSQLRASKAEPAHELAATVEETPVGPPFSGHFKVHIQAAKDLKDADFMGKSDPYVVVSLPEESGSAELVKGGAPSTKDGPLEPRTTVKDGTCDPLWDESMVLKVKDVPEGSGMVFSVYDEDGKKDTPLGKSIVPLDKHLLSSHEKADAKWYPVHAIEKDGSPGKQQGELLLDITAYPEGEEVPDEEAAAAPVDDSEGKEEDLTGLLTVKVQAAKDLRDADWAGKSDPYTVVTVDGVPKKTKVIGGTTEPVWNEDMQFPLTDVKRGSEIKVQVYDDDDGLTGADDSLGTAYVPLDSRITGEDGKPQSGWYPLYTDEDRSKQHGEILLDFAWDPAWDATAAEEAAKKAAEEEAARKAAEEQAKADAEAAAALKKAEEEAAAAAEKKAEEDAAAKIQAAARGRMTRAELAAQRAKEAEAEGLKPPVEEDTGPDELDEAALKEQRADLPEDGMVSGTLLIKLLEGRGLPAGDDSLRSGHPSVPKADNSACDPYGVISVLGSEEVVRGATVRDTVEPKWDATYMIELKDVPVREAAMRVEVWDEDTVASAQKTAEGKAEAAEDEDAQDDILGATTVPLGKFLWHNGEVDGEMVDPSRKAPQGWVWLRATPKAGEKHYGDEAGLVKIAYAWKCAERKGEGAEDALTSEPMDEEEAAIRLQALARGRLERARLEKARAEAAERDRLADEAAAAEKAAAEAAEKLREEEAALLIQSAARGRAGRKEAADRLAKLRADAAAAEAEAEAARQAAAAEADPLNVAARDSQRMLPADAVVDGNVLINVKNGSVPRGTAAKAERSAGDPYVLVHVLGTPEVAQSDTVNDTTQPVWDGTYIVNVAEARPREMALRFEVWDEDTQDKQAPKDKLVGVAVVPIGSLALHTSPEGGDVVRAFDGGTVPIPLMPPVPGTLEHEDGTPPEYGSEPVGYLTVGYGWQCDKRSGKGAEGALEVSPPLLLASPEDEAMLRALQGDQAGAGDDEFADSDSEDEDATRARGGWKSLKPDAGAAVTARGKGAWHLTLLEADDLPLQRGDDSVAPTVGIADRSFPGAAVPTDKDGAKWPQEFLLPVDTTGVDAPLSAAVAKVSVAPSGDASGAPFGTALIPLCSPGEDLNRPSVKGQWYALHDPEELSGAKPAGDKDGSTKPRGRVLIKAEWVPGEEAYDNAVAAAGAGPPPPSKDDLAAKQAEEDARREAAEAAAAAERARRFAEDAARNAALSDYPANQDERSAADGVDAFLDGGEGSRGERTRTRRHPRRTAPPEVHPDAVFGVGTGIGTARPKQLLPHRTAAEVESTADRFVTPGPGSYQPAIDPRGKSTVTGAESSAHRTPAMYATAAEWDLIRQAKGQRAISPGSAAVIATSSFAHQAFSPSTTRPGTAENSGEGSGVWGHKNPRGAFFGSTARPWQAAPPNNGVPGPGSYNHGETTGLGMKKQKRKKVKGRRANEAGDHAGRSVVSTKRSAPSYSFGSSGRGDAFSDKLGGPGPGDHQHMSAATPAVDHGRPSHGRPLSRQYLTQKRAEHPIGRGVGNLSHRRRAPGYSFGGAPRSGPRNKDKELFPAPGVHQGPGFNSSIGVTAGTAPGSQTARRPKPSRGDSRSRRPGRPDSAPPREQYDNYERYSQPSSAKKPPPKTLNARERVVGHTPVPSFGIAPRGLNPGDEQAYVQDPSTTAGVRAARAAKKYYDVGPAPGDHRPRTDMGDDINRYKDGASRGRHASFGHEGRFAPGPTEREHAKYPGPGAHEAHRVMASGDPNYDQETTVTVQSRRNRLAPHPPARSTAERAELARTGRSVVESKQSQPLSDSQFARGAPDGSPREYVVQPGRAASGTSPVRGRRAPAPVFGTSTREHPFLAEGGSRAYGTAWRPRL